MFSFINSDKKNLIIPANSLVIILNHLIKLTKRIRVIFLIISYTTAGVKTTKKKKEKTTSC